MCFTGNGGLFVEKTNGPLMGERRVLPMDGRTKVSREIY